MSKHTPEPWNGKCIGIAVHYFESIDAEITFTGKSDEAMANARRIVACVNFCAGVSTENLENNEKLLWLAEQYNTAKNQRDELLETLEAAVKQMEDDLLFIDSECGSGRSLADLESEGELPPALLKSRELISNLKGGAS